MNAVPYTPKVATGRSGVQSQRTVIRLRSGAFCVAILGWSSTTFADPPNSLLLSSFEGVPPVTVPFTPGITLYGAVDEAIGFMKGASSSSFVQQSGGEWTTKLGFFGVEDLGAGYRARFNLESGIDGTNGKLQATSTLFNREAWVAIGSRQSGELKLGLQDLIGGIPLPVDVFGEIATVSTEVYLAGWTYDLGPGASALTQRMSNAISYNSPRFGPFGAQFAVSLADPGTNAPTVTNRSLAFNYFNGRILGTVGYSGNYGELGVPYSGLPASSYIRTDNFGASVIYDSGRYVLTAGYSFLAPRLAGDRDAWTVTTGAWYRFFGRNDVRAQFTYRNVLGSDSRSYGITLGYDYNLSNRSGIYVRGALIHNSGTSPSYGNSHYHPIQPALDLPYTSPTSADGSQNSTPHVVLVGVYHKF